ncbi:MULTISPECIES: hypothetical protein [Legionella]|uniref:DUF1579 domain-containing protein n=1 Tax=Legionella septentrionalis TaxID=2498109 RepID=A0A3S0VAD4_9GAMM|nr:MULTISPECIES: hypothetical protein [Legionella]MCP0913327.1 hypothetical protein [Legionella sp. 27cVA30]RUQ85174.1 hypothetical protein EKM59_07085 [Legionella septentrionalis]RUQ98004.1 hypothetical protein ELY11_06015 [Legionella septentrionalis]RUR09022.1 hypothetical protein ELY14_09875 [Legionella septentrionalis]RUR14684.1 hypothetical protein ELY10_08070 [Legionella septentrionalis]
MDLIKSLYIAYEVVRLKYFILWIKGSIMKKILAISIALLASSAYAAETASNESQMMQPPKPVENKVYDQMVGIWRGESNMMGMKMQETMKIRWALNHQYLILELNTKGDNRADVQYEGKGVFGLTANGQAKTWWFDSWGADNAATGTGTFSDNKLELTDGNDRFNETRTFEIKGNEMIMHAKGSMTMPNGKKMDFDQTVTYKKIS